MTELPLKGIVVIDFSRVLAGPLSTMTLGDLGATVIKLEHPQRGDDTRDWGVAIAPGDTSYFYSFNRNKQSVACDISTKEGQEFAAQLCRSADVVVENFKFGGMEKYGLGYDALRKENPGLIYCGISGYDRQGVEAGRPGYDLVIQGESGLMSINGEAGQPPLKFGIAAVDILTGMYAAQGILAAICERGRTGKGRRVDLSLYDCGVMLTSYYGLEALLQSHDPVRYGNAHPSIVPYGVFQASDGPLVITVGNNGQFRSLCEVLERPQLADDPLYRTNLLRCENRTALLTLLTNLLSAGPRAVWLAKLREKGIPSGEVVGLYEALTSKRTVQSDLVGKHAHPTGREVPVFNPPWRFDGMRPPVSRPPMLNEHAGLVLPEAQPQSPF